MKQEWKKLTPEEQRIKVADLLGFKDIHQLKACSAHDGWVGLPRNDTPGGPWVFGDNHVPDYLGDLNAMHEAENTIPLGLRRDYDMRLRYRCGDSDVSVFAYDATAAQRAEAFVLTMEGGAE